MRRLLATVRALPSPVRPVSQTINSMHINVRIGPPASGIDSSTGLVHRRHDDIVTYGSQKHGGATSIGPQRLVQVGRRNIGSFRCSHPFGSISLFQQQVTLLPNIISILVTLCSLFHFRLLCQDTLCYVFCLGYPLLADYSGSLCSPVPGYGYWLVGLKR